MPSVIHRSALMQGRKIALISQDLVEQGNGLVQVSLSYTAAASDAFSVLPLFRVDSQPPINPSMIDLRKLQSQKLYMQNVSSSQANGLLQITAAYVGASLSALSKPQISDSVERQSITFRVPVFRVIEGGEMLFDTYRIELSLRNEDQQLAVIADAGTDYPAPPVLDSVERAGLLSGGLFTSRKLIFEGSLASSSLVQQPGLKFRSMSALQILQDLVGLRSASQKAGAVAVNVGKIEHVTPTVRLMSKSFKLQFNEMVLFAKYGARVR